MPVIRSLIASLAVVTLTAMPVSANDFTLRDSDGWSFGVAGALYAPLRSWGTSTIDGVGASFDMDLGEALEVLDFTLDGRAEAWNGRFGIVAEGHYLGISAQNGRTIGAGSRIVRVEATQSWLGLLGAYRVSQGQLANGQPFAFDLQGGARYNRIKQTIVGTGGAINLGRTQTWWEPVIAARFAWGIDDKWSASARADASGFGVNGNELAYSLTLAASKKINDNTSFLFGWRYYAIDYATMQPSGLFAYDMRQNGPFIGVSYIFD